MTLLGVVAGLIPNPHHNQSPRYVILLDQVYISTFQTQLDHD